MDQLDIAETTRLRQLYAQRAAAPGSERAGCVSPDAILALVLREGSEEDRLATLDHVMSCDACYRDYQWLSAADEAGLETERTAATPERRTIWRRTPLALAASLAALVGAGVILSNALRPGPEPERGAGTDLTLIAPRAGASAAAPIAFTWRSLPGASRYVLEIQRTDGSVVLADTTADTVLVLHEIGQLPSSTYRWWVREVTDGSEPRSSDLRNLRVTAR
jgi:hypothetical protein